MDSAENDYRAALTQRAAEGVTSQGIASVDTDAANVARLDAGVV